MVIKKANKRKLTPGIKRPFNIMLITSGAVIAGTSIPGNNVCKNANKIAFGNGNGNGGGIAGSGELLSLVEAVAGAGATASVSPSLAVATAAASPPDSAPALSPSSPGGGGFASPVSSSCPTNRPSVF